LINDSLANYTFLNANDEPYESGTKYVALINVKWVDPETQVDAIVEVVLGISSSVSYSTTSQFGFNPHTDVGCGTSNSGQIPGGQSIVSLYLNDCSSNSNFKPTQCNNSTFGLTYDVLDYRAYHPVGPFSVIIVSSSTGWEPYGPLWFGNKSDCWSFGTTISRAEDIATTFTPPSGEEMVLYMFMGSIDLSVIDPTNYPNKGAWSYRDWAGIPKYIDAAPYTTPTYEI